MKKITIFFFIIISIIVGMSYLYLNYKAKYTTTKKENLEFESYYNQEIYGTDLTSIINKAYDYNLTNQVNKDSNGIFEDNNINSIKIEIKILDNSTTYIMETLYKGGMDNFVKYYGGITFKCTEITYHKATHKVKYMLFEQITQ